MKGQAAGRTVHQVLAEKCGACDGEQGYANGQIKSFALGNDCECTTVALPLLLLPSNKCELPADDSEDDDGVQADLLRLIIQLEVGICGLVKLHMFIPDSACVVAVEATSN